MKSLKNIFIYLKRAWIMELKTAIIYPVSFWLTFSIVPLYTVVQILFIETMYLQTTTFAGYSKTDTYILFGSYRITQSLGYLLVYKRLVELKSLIRGDAGESFDNVLTKPIDSQIYATLGRFSFGNIGPIIIGIILVWYGLSKGRYSISLWQLVTFGFIVILGVILMYLSFMILRACIFWFGDLSVSEGLWDSLQDFGQFPRKLYTGWTGIFFNIILPITLMAGIPSEIITKGLALPTVFLYVIIIIMLVIASRIFWQVSIKKYSSFSS